MTRELLRDVRVWAEHATVIVSSGDGHFGSKTKEGRFKVSDASVRDTRVLTWIGEMRGVPVEVVPWLLGRWSPVAGQVVVGERTARRWVERVESRGLVERVKVLGEPWVLLTLHGSRLMGVGWSRYGVPRSRADHQRAKVLVRRWLEDTSPGSHWVTEGVLFNTDPREWHRPDAAVVTPGGNSVAVEVELSRKASFRDGLRDIMERMPPWVDAVWWFAPRQDVEWLAGRLAGSALRFDVRELPTLDPATHPASCQCAVCRVAALAEGHGEHVHAALFDTTTPGILRNLRDADPMDANDPVADLAARERADLPGLAGSLPPSGDTVVSRAEMEEAWVPLADLVPRELGGNR